MRRYLTVIFAIALTWSVGAAPSAEEMADQARYCRERAQEALTTYDNLVGAFSYHGEFTRADIKLAKPAFDEQASAWLAVAGAYEKGDAAGAATLRVAADATNLAVTRWRERLDARVKEGEIGPREGAYYEARHHTVDPARPALTALFDAQCAAGEAWCALAEATTPQADADALADLREAALAATDEVELARAAWEVTSRREQLATEKGAGGADVRQALEKLRQLDEQRLQARRQQLEQARNVRRLEREAGKLEAAVRKDVEAARKGKS